jgi:ERCC4-related helicase
VYVDELKASAIIIIKRMGRRIRNRQTQVYILVIAPAKLRARKSCRAAFVQYGAAGSGSSSCQLWVATEALLKIKMAGNAPF